MQRALLSIKSYWLQFYDKITNDDFHQKIYNAIVESLMMVFYFARFFLRLIIDLIIVDLLCVVYITVVDYYPFTDANIHSFIYQVLSYAIAIPLVIIFKKIILSYLY